MNKKEIAEVLRAIADLIDRSDQHSIKKLLEGKASLIIVEGLEIDPETSQVKIHWERVKNRLQTASSPEEGHRILKEEGVDRRKRTLEELAKHYDVAVEKSEPKSSLANHIIDVVVGSRIYSETMRSLDLHSHAKRNSFIAYGKLL